MIWLLFGSTLLLLVGLLLALAAFTRTARLLQDANLVAAEVAGSARSAANPRPPTGR